MKLSAVIASLAAAGSAMPPELLDQPLFQVMAMRSGSPIHFHSISASNGSLFLREPNHGAVCEVEDRDRTSYATFRIENSILHLHTGKGVKQVIYVDRSAVGQVKIGYTTPKENELFPKRFEYMGWTRSISGNLRFHGRTLIACVSSTSGKWTVWLSNYYPTHGIHNFCLGFSARTLPARGAIPCKYSDDVGVQSYPPYP